MPTSKGTYITQTKRGKGMGNYIKAWPMKDKRIVTKENLRNKTLKNIDN